MSRSLSDLEAKLILHLEWEKQTVVTIEDTMAILDRSYDPARPLLHRLARRRWLIPLTPGKYELIPAERGEHAFPDTNPLIIGSALVEPYYLSFATAAFFHGLSTQASATVYLATSVRTGRRLYRYGARSTAWCFSASTSSSVRWMTMPTAAGCAWPRPRGRRRQRCTAFTFRPSGAGRPGLEPGGVPWPRRSTAARPSGSPPGSAGLVTQTLPDLSVSATGVQSVGRYG